MGTLSLLTGQMFQALASFRQDGLFQKERRKAFSDAKLQATRGANQPRIVQFELAFPLRMHGAAKDVEHFRRDHAFMIETATGNPPDREKITTAHCLPRFGLYDYFFPLVCCAT